MLEQLIEAGADVFRLNFSHADRERQARRSRRSARAAERVGREVAVLGDLPGPKLRIGELRDDVAELETGMHVTLTPREVEGDRRARSRSPGPASPSCARTSSSTSPTARSACGSTSRDDGGVDCEVEVGGTLSSHKGMNIPGGDRLPAVDRRRPRLGRVRGRARRRPARRLLRLHRRRPRAGRASGCARSAPTSR